MKIALVSFIFDPELGAGSAAVAHSLAHSLTTAGLEVLVITTHQHGPPLRRRESGMTIFSFAPHNLYWVGVKDRQPAWKKVLWQLLDLWNPHTYATLRPLLRQERPELVHVHKLRGISPAVWSAAAAAGVRPIVHTSHDYELMSPEGTLEGRLGQLARQGHWLLRPYQQLRARSSRVLDGMTAPSRYTLELLSAAGFGPRAVRRAIPNSHGLSSAELERRRGEPAPAPEQPGRLRLLYLGRLESNKGVDLLCAAVARCSAELPQLQLDVVGYGSLEPLLRERYGQHPQIRLRGPLFGPDKQALMAQSDLLVVPSVYLEISPLVIYEAYAQGKPVLATTAGGLPELVDDGQTGWLVPPGDERALSATLRTLASDPALARQMRQSCFEAAHQFTRERITDQYRALYQEL